MSVKIIIDSGCDMSKQEAEAQGLYLLPLKTRIDGTEYLDGVTITSEAFYEMLETCKELPTTSQIGPYEYEEAYKDVTADGSEAVVITISGKLSGTGQSARIASEGYEGQIYVVDSQSVACGERILVEYAMELRDQGLSAQEIAEELEQVRGRICVVALLDTLEYLKRGGRLSKTAAIAGTLLNIKPVLGIEAGELAVLGKARGSRQSSNMLTETIQKKGGIDFSMPLRLAYSGRDDALLRGYIENSRGLWEGNIEELPIAMIGSTIGTHAGPGAIAVAFFAKA